MTEHEQTDQSKRKEDSKGLIAGKKRHPRYAQYNEHDQVICQASLLQLHEV
jgi:hypothetical protein